jgi:tRNA-dihydrouridine synthase B
MLKIGDITIPSRLLLSPLAGVSDLPFRTISRSFGCEFTFLAMVSARTLGFLRRKTRSILSTTPDDKPLGIQLLGAEPDIIRKAMELLSAEGGQPKHNFDIIDLNAACPVRKVVNRGEGAGLLKDPRKLNSLLKIMVAGTTKPVTVKIRSGWDANSINAVDVALAAQDAGIKALFIHGRTKVQGYSGAVNYEIIRQVKQALSIPVIASGDALAPRLIKRLFDETGCDGVAIARGALGTPWIFPATAQFLKTGTIPEPPGFAEIIDTVKKHLELCIGFYGERVGVIVFHKLFHWYLRDIPGIRAVRERAFHTKTRQQVIDIISELCALHNQDVERAVI